MPEQLSQDPAVTGSVHQPDLQDIASRWDISSGTGQLEETLIGQVTRHDRLGGAAIQLLKAEGRMDDGDMAYVIANAENDLREKASKDNAKDELRIIERSKMLKSATPEQAENIELANAKTRARVEERGKGASENLSDSPKIVDVAINELDNREKTALEKAIQARIEADMFPWTMPGLKPERAEELKREFETMFGSPDKEVDKIEASPDDKFIINPLRNVGGYSEEDIALVGERINGKYTTSFTRQELMDAGVFFVNNVGDGEQPLFGQPIPDDKQPDGYFHPENRVFLTEEEFEKVYNYQMQTLKESGIDLKNIDIAQLQAELMMLAKTGKLPEGCDAKIMSLGGRERDPRGDVMRSPFVDSGRKVSLSVGALICNGEGSKLSDYLRINTTSIALLNKHSRYPGLSEMKMTNGNWTPQWRGIRVKGSASHDQRYASIEEVLQSGWLPAMTTAEEALFAIKTGGKTPREKLWSGN